MQVADICSLSVLCRCAAGMLPEHRTEMARRSEPAVGRDVGDGPVGELQQLQTGVDDAGDGQEMVDGLPDRLLEQAAEVFVGYAGLGRDVLYGQRLHVSSFDCGNGAVDDRVGVVGADVLDLADAFRQAQQQVEACGGDAVVVLTVAHVEVEHVGDAVPEEIRIGKVVCAGVVHAQLHQQGGAHRPLESDEVDGPVVTERPVGVSDVRMQKKALFLADDHTLIVDGEGAAAAFAIEPLVQAHAAWSVDGFLLVVVAEDIDLKRHDVFAALAVT